MQLHLPQPSINDLIISNTLKQLIIKDIRHSGGWISFARYMELALYTPHLGYYNRDTITLGKTGDFITAPEISPLFGITLAHIIIELFNQKTAFAIMEFGAGTGKLAFDILSEMAKIGYLPRYYIIEISTPLRFQQQILLYNFSKVEWLETLPLTFSGIIIGNEVLDAMPINLIIRGQNSWFERGVTLDISENFIYDDHRCDANLLVQVSNTNITYQTGYLTEVHLIAMNFIRSLATILTNEKSVMILIDYGFPAHEYYIPERNQGTLMCHYRHHAHSNPFYLPGLQDITAHVDFTAIARTAIENGLELLNYTSQAALLLNAGIEKFLLRTSPNQTKQYLPQANAVEKLISPAEMGELFKVLVVGKNIIWPQHMMPHDRKYCL